MPRGRERASRAAATGSCPWSTAPRPGSDALLLDRPAVGEHSRLWGRSRLWRGPPQPSGRGSARWRPPSGGLLAGPLGLGRWATVYWAAAVAVGLALIVGYYRRRAGTVGARGRVWPVVAVTGGLLALVPLLAACMAFAPMPELSTRGTGALVLLVLGVAVLAVLERSVALALLAAGLLALALASCSYDDVDLLQRVGLAGPFEGGAVDLPSLPLPGLYPPRRPRVLVRRTSRSSRSRAGRDLPTGLLLRGAPRASRPARSRGSVPLPAARARRSAPPVPAPRGCPGRRGSGNVAHAHARSAARSPGPSGHGRSARPVAQGQYLCYL